MPPRKTATALSHHQSRQTTDVVLLAGPPASTSWLADHRAFSPLFAASQQGATPDHPCLQPKSALLPWQDPSHPQPDHLPPAEQTPALPPFQAWTPRPTEYAPARPGGQTLSRTLDL
ncbi:uncharacterized protein A4U43_C02F14290 [Asparagus officinalis]|uniref:Uncharacterized protein n=1 Tax=Asparagus officinalis TaxID=4686 RepID=A0A5P1FIE2_ASPOF|nr:uncharacterized protein A4U43_C02F14290 [Asparagus officinalis]